MPRHSYLYGVTDDQHPKKLKKEKYLQQKKFKRQFETKAVGFTSIDEPFLGKVDYYDKKEMPIEFKNSPDTLLQLVANAVDKLEIRMPYEWTNTEVCKWIKTIGFPEYVSTFRINLINGRKLLLIDASALSAMNIKDFNTIRCIVYNIRSIFYFILTKSARSLSLPSEFPYELFKLLLTKTGTTFKLTRPTDFWRSVQLLRNKVHPMHWDIIEHWVNLRHLNAYTERFGGIRRFKLFQKPNIKQTDEHDIPLTLSELDVISCECVPPCTYYDEKVVNELPSVLKCLRKRNPVRIKVQCKHCVPPCECHWKSKQLRPPGILSICSEYNTHIKYK